MPNGFELPSGWEIYIAMVFLNFTAIAWAEASVNAKARGCLEAVRAPRRGASVGMEGKHPGLVKALRLGSRGGELQGGRSPSFRVPALPCAIWEKGRDFRVLTKEHLSLPMKAWEARPKGCFWL